MSQTIVSQTPIYDAEWEHSLLISLEDPPQIRMMGDSPRVRESDPPTSHAAADSNTNRELVEAHVYALLRRRAMNDWELTKAYFADDAPEADFDSPRKRRSDLVKKGLVVSTGELRPARSGRAALVWTAS